MAGRIPENILEDILSRVNIGELIGSYIPLKRAGKNFKAACPFHHEKTPSFMVSSDRQIYHCFGCGAGGNAINFLMQYERMEFIEAVQTLARKVGVIIPETQKQDTQAVNLLTQLYKVNELAGQFYAQLLPGAFGRQAKEYILKRGINEETIAQFKLGLSADSWDGLITSLRAKGVPLSIMEKAGLILSKESGGYYDRFRKRLIFPIFDIKSRILGFGARMLIEDKNDAQPKYINSPETAVYAKGRNLYGLNFSKDFIRDADCAVVVEGYLDYIVPFQEGVKNIVASLGTAFTPDQARLLKRYTNNVVMIYDPDKAGELAALRSLDIFIEEGMNVKVVSLPEGFDPDLYVRKYGSDNLKQLIAQAQDLFEYKLKILRKRYNSKEISGKANIATEMLATINKFKHAVLKSEYVKKLAAELNVNEESLWEEVKKIKEPKFSSLQRSAQEYKEASVNPTEKLLVKIMLEESSFIEHIRQHLEPGDFQDERVSKIVTLMFELLQSGKKIETCNLMHRVEGTELQQLICETSFAPEISEDNRQRVVDDCIKRLKHEKIKSRRNLLHEQIKDAQHLGDEERLRGLMNEFHQLVKSK